MSKAVALTTTDNPYDPFDEFDNWYAFDVQKGYNSCALLARVANTSSELPDANLQSILSNAIDSICLFNENGKFKKVEREVED